MLLPLTLWCTGTGKTKGDRETEGKSPSLPQRGIESERVNKGVRGTKGMHGHGGDIS